MKARNWNDDEWWGGYFQAAGHVGIRKSGIYFYADVYVRVTGADGLRVMEAALGKWPGGRVDRVAGRPVRVAWGGRAGINVLRSVEKWVGFEVRRRIAIYEQFCETLGWQGRAVPAEMDDLRAELWQRMEERDAVLPDASEGAAGSGAGCEDEGGV